MTESQDRHFDLHREIIERCKKNDPKAQFKIYELYYKAMFNASLRIIQDVRIAEDVMQEAFLTAFEKIETFKGESAFGAWLKKIVINRSLDELKKKRPIFDPIETTLEIPIGPEDSLNEEDETELLNKIARVKETVNLLPDGYRIILSLYLFEGFDHEEISEILQISESTSRSQFSRARQKLLDLLKKTS